MVVPVNWRHSVWVWEDSVHFAIGVNPSGAIIGDVNAHGLEFNESENIFCYRVDKFAHAGDIYPRDFSNIQAMLDARLAYLALSPKLLKLDPRNFPE